MPLQLSASCAVRTQPTPTGSRAALRRTAVKIVIVLTALGWTEFASADLLTVEATIKAIDAKGHAVTVTRKAASGDKTMTLEVSPDAKITVGGRASKFDSLSIGQKAKVSYESKLEMITKIEVVGAGNAGAPIAQLVRLTELNKADLNEFGPWVSDDALTIYWSAFGPKEPNVMIWTASRRDPEGFFEKPKRLLPGYNPTVTSDGLTMIFNNLNNHGSLQVTSRSSIDQPFRRPTAIRELQDQPFSRRPCISGDGRTLLYERVRADGKAMEFCFTTRATAAAPWSSPEPLPIDRSKIPSFNLTSLYLTRDGSTLLCADARTFTDGTSNFMIWTKSQPNGPFDIFDYVQIDGVPAFGVSPRYVEASHELYFNTDKAIWHTHDGTMSDLFVVKNFKLPSPAVKSR